MSHCQIFIENQYYPGSTVTGKLICNFNSEKTVRSIKVRLTAKEHTEWTERESHYDPVQKKHRSRYVQYTGNNEILNLSITVEGGSNTRTMGAGRYQYDFSFNLPSFVPSSFDGTYGWIKYRIKAVVDRPMKFDIEKERFFNVIAPIDFNQMSLNLQHPCQTGEEKFACCCCCAHGPITLDMYLEKSAFILGENINIKLHVTNMSNINVENIEIKLTQTLNCKVCSPSTKEKDETELLASMTESGVGAHGENTYMCKLQVPSYVILPNFQKSSLFKIRHKLKASCLLGSCRVDLEVQLYPHLGHIQVNQGPGTNHFVPPPMPVPPYSPPQYLESSLPTYPETTCVNPVFPALPNSAYPPPVAGFIPQPNDIAYPPPSVGFVPVPSGSSNEKAVFDGGNPTAPSADSAEAPSAPPPSYEDLGKLEKK